MNNLNFCIKDYGQYGDFKSLIKNKSLIVSRDFSKDLNPEFYKSNKKHIDDFYLKLFKFDHLEEFKKYVVKITKKQVESENELKVSSLFNSDQIIKIHSGFTNEIKGKNYLIMDFIEGNTFQKFCEENEKEKISLEQSKKILKQVFSTICLFLKQNVIPKDLHSENIMIGPNEHVTFIDLELYHIVDTNVPFKDSNLLGLLKGYTLDILTRLSKITQNPEQIEKIYKLCRVSREHCDLRSEIEFYSKMIDLME